MPHPAQHPADDLPIPPGFEGAAPTSQPSDDPANSMIEQVVSAVEKYLDTTSGRERQPGTSMLTGDTVDEKPPKAGDQDSAKIMEALTQLNETMRETNRTLAEIRGILEASDFAGTLQ